MPGTYNPIVRIFKDNSSKTVETALSKVFYGPGSAGQSENNGYPDASLTNLPFDLEAFEITPPTDLEETVDITTNTTTVISSGTPFTSGDVGKYLWDATDPTALNLIGKIATYDGTNEVYLESAYKGPTLNDAPCYISSSANNNSSFNIGGDFILLIQTELGEDAAKRIFPNNNTSDPGLSTVANTNNNYQLPNSLNPVYINLKRISEKGIKEDPVTEEIIPASITRINRYLPSTANGVATYFAETEDFPIWTAYKINPFSTSSRNFNKNTVYSLEISDTIPYYNEMAVYSTQSSAASGYF